MDFIKEIVPLIQKYAKQYGVEVYSPIIAQAILESGRGTSELALKAHNYFGLKYNEFVSEKEAYIKIGSEQNADGSYISSTMKWCNFSTIEHGVEGYFKFLFCRPNNHRYDNLKGITNPKTYLETIKADGYATSLKYVDNLLNVISKYNLTQYDVKMYYRVQCGAFSKKTNAEKLKQQIDKYGFHCIIKQYDNLYKVQIGAFSSQLNAEKTKENLIAKGFNAFIVYC